SDSQARILKARYYGEISYIDHCIGRILDAVEARDDAANTLICFYADHGDHMGDHHGWQKESFFESSTRIPFLLSWPDRLPQQELRSCARAQMCWGRSPPVSGPARCCSATTGSREPTVSRRWCERASTN